MNEILEFVQQNWHVGLLGILCGPAMLLGFVPTFVLRVGLLLYPKDHVRRVEFLAELKAVPWHERPTWVAGNLPHCMFEGPPARLAQRRQARREHAATLQQKPARSAGPATRKWGEPTKSTWGDISSGTWRDIEPGRTYFTALGKWLEGANITRSELAKRIGCAPSTLSQLLGNKGPGPNPTTHTALQWARQTITACGGTQHDLENWTAFHYEMTKYEASVRTNLLPPPPEPG